MVGGAITTGAAPVGAMPGEDDVGRAVRTAGFSRSSAWTVSVPRAHGASCAPSSARDSDRVEAARDAFPDRGRSEFGSDGFISGAGDSSSTFAGFDEDRQGREEEGGGTEK